MKPFQKPLTAAEEKYYLDCLKDEDSEKARAAKEILVERNMRLVAHVVKKYQNVNEEMDDLLAVGCIGLIKAISSFDAGKGRLATYACRCIDNAILSQMRLWFQTNTPRAVMNPNGVFWHRFPRIYTSFVPLRTGM